MKRDYLKKCIVFVLAVMISAAQSLVSQEKPVPQVRQIKNIILMIGDGMGIAQIVSTRVFYRGAAGKLNIQKMPVVGLVDTHSADELVTDSAASGTAMATGHKTNNGMISLLPDGTMIKTILEACLEKGMGTGLVATSRITHATPASFASHNVSRNNEDDIAVQLINTGVHVLLGGGKDYFLPNSSRASKRKDQRNLLQAAREKGYRIIENAEQLSGATGPKVLGLFAMKHLEFKSDIPSIGDMTRRGIELLKTHSNGFFLMVEGSQIDWECHVHDEREMYKQLIQFDIAVGEAIKHAENNPDTLVVVVADHETGGMTIVDGKLSGKKIEIEWTTRGHTAVSVPIFSLGAGAGTFTGWFDNTDIPKKFAQLLGINNFPSKTE